MEYLNGEKYGTWLIYDEKGTLVSKKEY